MLKYCDHCGALIPKLAERCTRCGVPKVKFFSTPTVMAKKPLYEMSDSELLSKKMVIENEIRRRLLR